MRGDDAYAILKKKMQDMQGEKIQESVNRYFDEHPVQAGATAEQVQQIEQNKKDVNSLREDLSTKITKFYASSQGETHLADSDNGKITDMVLYGRSEQKQYSGKNLLNATLQTTTVNGVTCTNNGDGTYTLDGTANANAVFNLGSVTFTGDTKYKICGCPQGGGIIERYHIEPYGSTNEQRDIGNGVIYSLSNDETKAIYIVVTIGFRASNLLFKPMITTDLTATYDDFEPYTGGQPSPSPDYPQEIKSVVNPAIKICGKNLLKATLQTTTVNGVTCTNNGDGTYTLNGTCTVSTPLSKIGIFDHILNEPLYLTGVPSGCGSYLALSRYDGNNILVTDGKITKIDAGIHTKHIEFWITKGTTLNNVIFKPMITTDLTATYDDFEPYHEQTVTLPYTLNAIPVSSGGNVTIDGQQYIADYVDVERGKLVRMVDDVEAKNYIWDLYPGEINMPRRFGMNDTIRFNMPADIRIMSSHFKQIATNTRTDLSTWFQTYYIAITDMNEKWKNSEALIQWFSENNVHFYLPLKTPKEIDLTSEEIAAFKTLVTYYPTTNISVNSEQLDGYTVFNYPISMANGWNYVKKQLNDNRDYIYDMDIQSAEAYVNSEYAVALTELEV